jgi:hypothetical protein
MTPVAGSAGSVASGSRGSLHTPPLKNLDAEHEEDAPLRFRKLTDILGTSTPPSQAARNPA